MFLIDLFFLVSALSAHLEFYSHFVALLLVVVLLILQWSYLPKSFHKFFIEHAWYKEQRFEIVYSEARKMVIVNFKNSK